MAKQKSREKEFTIRYRDLKKKFEKQIPNIALIFLSEKILFDGILKQTANNFLGEGYDGKTSIKKFYSDETEIDEVINECSNLSFFSDKKIVVYRVVKKPGVRGIAKDSKEALLKYASNCNPDTVLIIHIPDKEFNFNNFEEFTGNENTGIFAVDVENHEEMMKWVKEKFDDYKISDNDIEFFLRFMNPSYDEIYTEIEKLKTFCGSRKEIKTDDVKMCAGFTRDFDEEDFIAAVLKRDKDTALKIYDKLVLKEDVEIFLVYLLSSAFMAMLKMRDKNIEKIPQGYPLTKELRTWGKKGSVLFGLYRQFGKEMNELKIKNAFDYIYEADKAMKGLSSDKKAVISNLINNLTSL